ncbi:ralBP1-associated Eps domain-containing protein 1-like isoform X3 [Asterias rubens]|uniref:ralBP1-associated Eps domain-containing protein 1-like isoform X3 n=1 Tax=Asterias rubens TaxID=7604 RepID=UPI00145514D1|nr:ralBP1-associated Eps domain-containing protein 1-like isoform X3 [Asterias rubens]
MDGSFLSPKEQQCYSALFSTLDTESAGRIKTVEVFEFFLRSGLNPEVLQQIVEICGANRVGHFGRSQFYIALKLIAMAQNAIPLPVSKEMMVQGNEVPLPTFVARPNAGVKTQADPDDPGQMEFVNPAFIDLGPDRSAVLSGKFQPSPRSHGSYPHGDPTMSPTRTAHVPPLNIASSPPPSSPRDSSPFNDNPPLSPPNTIEQQPSLSSPNNAREHQPILDKQGNTPGFLPKSDEGWASFDERDRQGDSKTTNSVNNLSSDTSWAKFPENRDRSGSDKSSGHDSSEDVWLITPEQREYYTNQFKTLIPNTKGLLSGADSKEFFEKSKLPTAELSKIWQLSDVNKDGTLSLAEFCTAMHLVVARKHKVDLPDQLPASLIPVISPNQEEAPYFIPAVGVPKQVTTPARSVTPPTPSTKKEKDEDANIFQPVALHVAPDGKTVKIAPDAEGRQRTHSDPLRIEALSDEDKVEEEDSAFTMKKRAATVGEKDILAKLAPPPPVERTRRGDSLERGVMQCEAPDGYIKYTPRSRSRSYSGVPLQQRLPVPLSRHSALTESSLEPSWQGQSPTPIGTSIGTSIGSSVGTPIGEELTPPALPPRFNGTHSRSMSLDRKQLILLPERQVLPPRPSIPPRPITHSSSHSSDQTHSSAASSNRSSFSSSLDGNEAEVSQGDFADFSHFHDDRKGDSMAAGQGDYLPMHLPSPMLSSKDRHMSSDMLQADERRSQFANDRKRHTSAPEAAGVSSDLMLCDRKSIQAAIRRAKEENTKLSRLNSELQQELTQITEDRLSLEIDLKKLRPFAVNT